MPSIYFEIRLDFLAKNYIHMAWAWASSIEEINKNDLVAGWGVVQPLGRILHKLQNNKTAKA